MTIKSHCQVVANEVLARDTQVHRVPVLELRSERLQSGSRDVCLWERAAQVNVVENVIVQLFGFDATRVGFGPIKVSLSLKHVCDGVVGHVNGAVREGLDHPLLVPRHLSAQTKQTRTSPLLEPSESKVELVEDILRVWRELGRVVHVLRHLFFPRLLAIAQVPLISHGDHTGLPCATLYILLRFKVDESISLLHHIHLLLRLCDAHFLALVWTDQHATESEASIVCLLLRFVKLHAIFGRFDAQLLRPVLSCLVRGPCFVFAGRYANVDDGHSVKRQHHLVSQSQLLAVLWFSLELCHSDVVIGGVRRHRGHDSRSLTHADTHEGQDVESVVFGARS
mmetsp:Transcript_30131/g.35537  ORF Transcript_30131/g.35537 Transcript_30131/m.35537 type:complete len:338 (-) Transcript_30131:1151-2164(-)